MSKSFKAQPHVMIGWPIKPLMDSLDKLSARECVIIATSVIDTMLELALRSHFKSEDDHERAFDVGQPLHTFASKISMSYHFGIIPKSMKCDLERVNQIRTRFAHDFAEYGFDTVSPNISGLCEKLELPSNYKAVGQWLANNSNGKIQFIDTLDNEDTVYFTDGSNNIGAIVDASPQLRCDNRGKFVITIRLVWGYLSGQCKSNLLMPTKTPNEL